MRHIPLVIAAAACFAFATGPVANASTSNSAYGDIAAKQQLTTQKLAQAQYNDKKKNQGKRRSWGGG